MVATRFKKTQGGATRRKGVEKAESYSRRRRIHTDKTTMNEPRERGQ
jgi:hypothetical protein